MKSTLSFLTEITAQNMIILHCGSFGTATRSYYHESLVKQHCVVEQGTLDGVEFLNQMINRFASGVETTFSNNYVVLLALRLAVKRGLVNHEHVLVIHHTGIGEYSGITIDKNGKVGGWEHGFYDVLETALRELA